MTVNFQIVSADDLFSVPGVRIGVAEAGIRKANRKDLTLVLIDEGSCVEAVFTQNRFCAAPVQVCREHLDMQQGIRALVINTGNANAGTGSEGVSRARGMCESVAQLLEIKPHQVLPFSTGVIMEPLPLDRVQAGLPAALSDMSENHWMRAAEGIMTTDTVPKVFGQKIVLAGAEVRIMGISKGAGMIRPNMATMLGFMATDARISPAVMKQLALEIAEGSFNRITVDGDTSTNDSFAVIATQKADHPQIDSLDSVQGIQLKAAMLEVARNLAQAIVRDGEGATKFITVKVESGANSEECLKVAYAIAHSPLVKTAFFASDPNLGRILAAVGYAGIEDLDTECIDLYLDDVHVAINGGRHPDYKEEQGQRVMKQSEITIRVLLGRGRFSETVWTCDLSHDYVSINADYRS